MTTATAVEELAPVPWDHPETGMASLFAHGDAVGKSLSVAEESVAPGESDDGETGPGTSSISFHVNTVALKRHVANIAVSDEMYHDQTRLDAYLPNRGTDFITLEEERYMVEALRDKVGAFVRFDAPWRPTHRRRMAVSRRNLLIAIDRAYHYVETASALKPDYVVASPRTVTAMDLTMHPHQRPLLHRHHEAAIDYHDLKVFAWDLLGDDEALVGAFKQAGVVYRCNGIAVTADNVDPAAANDGIVHIRFVGHSALFLCRPAAFCWVKGEWS